MKVTKKDYEDLKQAIEEVLVIATFNSALAYKESLSKDARVKDYNIRFRWDLFWAIPRVKSQPIVESIYTYANDDHIDTALKHIVKDLSL